MFDSYFLYCCDLREPFSNANKKGVLVMPDHDVAFWMKQALTIAYLVWYGTYVERYALAN